MTTTSARGMLGPGGRRRRIGKLIHGQDATVYAGGQPQLGELIAPRDGARAAEPLSDEGAQRRVRGTGPAGVEDSGCARDAETALAGAHPQPRRAPQVVE